MTANTIENYFPKHSGDELEAIYEQATAGEHRLYNWMPSDEDTKAVVKKFLLSEPDWINNAIAKDPALYSKAIMPALDALRAVAYKDHSSMLARVKHDTFDAQLVQDLQQAIDSYNDIVVESHDEMTLREQTSELNLLKDESHGYLTAIPEGSRFKDLKDDQKRVVKLALHILEQQSERNPIFQSVSKAVDNATPFNEEQKTALLAAAEHDPYLKSGAKQDITRAINAYPHVDEGTYLDIVKEVLTYNGLTAIAWHKEAHELYKQGDRTEARIISAGVKRLTDIDIHPGAAIGKNFFIDHGVGVVVGETAMIGDNVTLFQGVTLGNKSKMTPGLRRHPKIGDDTTIYPNAKINGPVTIGDRVNVGTGASIMGNKLLTVGDDANIGAGVVVRRPVRASGNVVSSTQFGNYPDYDDHGTMGQGARHEDNKYKNQRWQALVNGNGNSAHLPTI